MPQLVYVWISVARRFCTENFWFTGGFILNNYTDKTSVGESYECQREVVRWFIILGLKCTSRGGVKRNDNVMSGIFKFKYVQAMPNIFKFKYVRAMSLVIMTPYWNTSKNSCPVRTSSTTHEFYVIMNYCVHNASSPPTAFAGTSTSTRGVPTSGCNNHGHFVFLRFCSIRPITLVVVVWVVVWFRTNLGLFFLWGFSPLLWCKPSMKPWNQAPMRFTFGM